MFLDNVAHNQQAEAIALFTSGAEGFVHVTHHLVRNTGTIVTYDDAYIRIIIISLNIDIITSMYLSLLKVMMLKNVIKY